MAQRQFRSDDTDKWLYGFGDGSAGDGSINTSTDAPIDSACSGTSGTTSLTATNASFASGQPILIHQTRGTGVGGWELNRIASYVAGTITLSHPLTMTYTNSGASVAQVLVMKQYNDLTINSAQTLTAKSWNGTVGGIIAYFVKGTATITGSISASGKGFVGGAAFTTRGIYGNTGEGTSGASTYTGTTAANGNGGGGGTGQMDYNQGGGGAGGGNGANGTVGANGLGGQPGGAVGVAVGVAALTTMDLGGGGGTGGTTNNTSSGVGAGGIGGGIVLIIASAISMGGSIVHTGTVGGNGAEHGGGSGGGAGGSCLLKCKTATLGTNLITTSAGGGGTGANDAGAGGAGSVGRIHLDYKTSYTGSTNPTIDVTRDISLDYNYGRPIIV
jgi:hypothetical protein